MGSALEITAAAYRRSNLDQPLADFASTEYPYSIARDLLNTVISEMNRKAGWWFTDTKTALGYGFTATYDLTALGVDAQRIYKLRKELSGSAQTLTPIRYDNLFTRFRGNGVTVNNPGYWAVLSDSLELDVIPDRDYQIYIYHYKDMPLVVEENDTLLLPTRDEGVVTKGILYYLLSDMGYPGAETAKADYYADLGDLLADNKRNMHLPNRMPARW